MTETLTIVIERGDNSMATSFLVWAKWKAFPQCDGDGVFVAEVEISPAETSVNYNWDTPNNQTDWKFIALPVFQEIVGLPGQVSTV
jgi:hypothetical protein